MGAWARLTFRLDDGTDLRRLTFIRGSRDYVVNLEGPAVPGEEDVLRLLLATAR